jgi:hypothetical protein
MRPSKPLEGPGIAGGRGEGLWQSFLAGVKEETILGSKPPVSYDPDTMMKALKEDPSALMDLMGPFGVGAGLLKRTVLREASKAASKTRKAFSGKLRGEFDETARSLFESIKALPEKSFEPLKEVGFPKELIIGEYGRVRGVVSTKPLRMDVALSPKEKASISKTLFHEMTHVGQAEARKAGDPAVLAMRKAKSDLFKQEIPRGVTSIGWALKRWKMDPGEQHAEELGKRLAGVLKGRLEKGGKLRVSEKEYKKAFDQALPRKFKDIQFKELLKTLDVDEAMPRIVGKVTGEMTPGKLTQAFKKIASSTRAGRDPSGRATTFGGRFFGDPKVGEMLRKSGEEAHEMFKKSPKLSDERSKWAFTSQLLREALEELEGRSPAKFQRTF